MSLVATGLVVRAARNPAGGGVTERIEAAEGGVVVFRGVRVTVEPGALSADADLTISEASDIALTSDRASGSIASSQGPLAFADPVSEAFRIEVSAAFRAPVTIELPYDSSMRTASDPALVFAGRRDESGRWEVVDGEADPAYGRVVVDTSTLSAWSVFAWDLAALRRAAATAFEGVLSAASISAPAPDCQEGSILGAEVSATDQAAPPVSACSEPAGETTTRLKLANHRAVALRFQAPASVEYEGASAPSIGERLSSLIEEINAAYLGGRSLIVPRGGTLHMLVDNSAQMPLTLRLRTDSGGLVFDAMLAALAAVAEAVGTGQEVLLHIVECVHGVTSALQERDVNGFFQEFGLSCLAAVGLGGLAVFAAVFAGLPALVKGAWDSITDIVNGAGRADVVFSRSGLVLQKDGLGVVQFGASETDAVSAVRALLGEPDQHRTETLPHRVSWPGGEWGDEPEFPVITWEYPYSRETCWRMLCIVAGGAGPQDSRFTGWSFAVWNIDSHYDAAEADPYITTDRGISVGSTFARVWDAYPTVTLSTGEGLAVGFNIGWEAPFDGAISGMTGRLDLSAVSLGESGAFEDPNLYPEEIDSGVAVISLGAGSAPEPTCC